MEKLKIGILGLRRGLAHLQNCLRLENVQVIGCADRTDACREQAAKRIAPQSMPMMREYEELLELKPDAVVVASNGRCQAGHAIQAMEAGYHVLSEVPGAFTQREILDLISAVQRTGQQYMLAENLCFLDYIRYWRKWVDEDRLGAISMAEGEYLHYLPKMLIDPMGERHSQTEAKRLGLTGLKPFWRADQPPIQYLTHDLGPLLDILNDRVVSVSCRSAPYWCEEAPLRSDGQIALFQTANGRLVKITVTLNTRRPPSHNFRLFGTQGSVEWYDHEGFCRLFDRDRDESQGWQRIDIGTAGSANETSGHGGTDINTVYHFANAILEGKSMPIDVYRMCDFTLPGILAAHSAELGGHPVTVPDMRRGSFDGTKLWEHVGLPENEPAARDDHSDR